MAQISPSAKTPKTSPGSSLTPAARDRTNTANLPLGEHAGWMSSKEPLVNCDSSPVTIVLRNRFLNPPRSRLKIIASPFADQAGYSSIDSSKVICESLGSAFDQRLVVCSPRPVVAV